MKTYMTPEEHARLHRRRGRQALGLVIAVLVLIGVLTVLHAGVNAVAKLFDDTAQKQEYEDKLEGLVLFDPVPFEGIENIDDLTLREAAVWGCVYSIQETQGGFDGYNTDPDTEQLLIPSVDVDAYLAKLVGPSFRMSPWAISPTRTQRTASSPPPRIRRSSTWTICSAARAAAGISPA